MGSEMPDRGGQADASGRCADESADGPNAPAPDPRFQEQAEKGHVGVSIMVESGQTFPQEDQILFRARYSPFRVWFIILVVLPLPVFLVAGAVYTTLRDGQGDWKLVFPLFILWAVLIFVFHAVFFKELAFHSDRVIRFRHLFGTTTIYYSRGSVSGPGPIPYLGATAYYLLELREDGRLVPMGSKFKYIAFFFPSDTRKKIDTIWDYLSDDTQSNYRVFKKATLPREVVWGSDTPTQPEHSPWGYEKSAQTRRRFAPFGMNRK